MHDFALTENARLGVSCVEIYVIRLTTNGLLPACRTATATHHRPQRYVCRHRPPSNLAEQTLLSMWINTHQAMFIATGIAAQCTRTAIAQLATDDDLNHVRTNLQLAVDCRLASAVYTSLPFLTRELYEAYVRESMKMVHPGFSGVSNREAITMETSLRAIKQAHAELTQRDRQRALAVQVDLQQLYAADKEWWRCHGQAMLKYVQRPESLAKMDFKNQKGHGSGDQTFGDYRERVLRQDGVIADYDEYFAVARSDELTIDDYRETLTRSLERSAPYIEKGSRLAKYRDKGTRALYRVLDTVRVSSGFPADQRQ